jgi:hypothetical protein
MPVDPRLANPHLLALAALRLKQRQESQADPYPVMWLDMNGEPEDPDARGQIYLPRKCASAEEWANSALIQGFRAKLRQLGEGAC